MNVLTPLIIAAAMVPSGFEIDLSRVTPNETGAEAFAQLDSATKIEVVPLRADAEASHLRDPSLAVCVEAKTDGHLVGVVFADDKGDDLLLWRSEGAQMPDLTAQAFLDATKKGGALRARSGCEGGLDVTAGTGTWWVQRSHDMGTCVVAGDGGVTRLVLGRHIGCRADLTSLCDRGMKFGPAWAGGPAPDSFAAEALSLSGGPAGRSTVSVRPLSLHSVGTNQDGHVLYCAATAGVHVWRFQRGHQFVPLRARDASGFAMNQVDDAIILADPRRVTVSLPEPSPTAVRCGLTERRLGANVELRWEVGDIDGLAQTVSLGAGRWDLACLAEPELRRVSTPDLEYERDVAWRFENANFVAQRLIDESTHFAHLVVQIPGPEPLRKDAKWPSEAFVTVTVTPLTDLARAVEGLGGTASGQFGGRSLLTAALPPQVIELLGVIAEIALDRAQAGAFELIKGKLQAAVCEELKGKLPRTCEVIRSTRLEDLFPQAEALFRAVTADAVGLVFGELHTRLRQASSMPQPARRMLDSLLQRVQAATLAVVTGRPLDVRREAQLLVTAMAKDSARWLDDELGEQPELLPVRCGLGVLFGVAAACLDRGRCDAGDILEMVSKPTAFFVYPAQCAELHEQVGPVIDHWAELPAVVSRVLDILDIPRDAKPLDVLGAAMDVALEIGDFVLEGVRRAGADLGPLWQSRQDVLRVRADVLEVAHRVSRATHSAIASRKAAADALQNRYFSGNTACTKPIGADGRWDGKDCDLAYWMKQTVDVESQLQCINAAIWNRVVPTGFPRYGGTAGASSSSCGAWSAAAAGALTAPQGCVADSLGVLLKGLVALDADVAGYLAATTGSRLTQSFDADWGARLDGARASLDEVVGYLDGTKVEEQLCRAWESVRGHETIQAAAQAWIEAGRLFESGDGFPWALATDKKVSQLLRDLLPPLEDAVRAAIHHKPAEALIAAVRAMTVSIEHGVEGASLNDKEKKVLRKATTLLTAIVSYAGSYTDEAEGQTAEDRREARKEAIEAMIDRATDRTHRGGDVVVSLGVSVGLRAGFHFGDERITTSKQTTFTDAVGGFGGTQQVEVERAVDSDGFYAPQLALPLGFAVQLLPGEDCWAGFHGMFYPIDVGQFLAYGNGMKIDEPVWWSFFSPGVQLGGIFGTPSQSVLVAADVHYAPARPGMVGDAYWRVGLAVAYYVPFFDFN